MRRLILLAACSGVWFMFGAAPASADNGPHKQGWDRGTYSCASCHRGGTQPGICYSCHSSTGSGAKTDVQGGVGYGDVTRATPARALRGGGFQFAVIDSANPTGQTDTLAVPPVSSSVSGVVPVKAVGSATTSSHTVDGTTGMAWGNVTTGTANAGSAISLRCGSCHDPHGNGKYRILKTLPRESLATVAVPIADATTKVYTTANYWKVDDTNAPAFIANVSAWCSTCHTRYLASLDSAGLLTSARRSHFDTGDAVYRYRHTSDGKTQGGKSCIQCHVSHGSNASMGTNSGSVGNPDGTLAPDDSKLLRIDNRGTCSMCHKR